MRLHRHISAHAALASLGLVVWGCGGGDAPQRTGAAAVRLQPAREFPGAPIRTCRSRAEPDVPETGPTAESVVLGPSAYFPALLAVAAQADPTPAPGRRFVEIKAVFALAAGTRATLVIPRAYRTRIGLEYVLPSAGRAPRAFTVHNGAAAVRFQACPAGEASFTGAGTVGPWTTFNGGLFVAGPGCYPLELHAPSEHVRYRRLVSFGGRAC